MCVCVCLSGEHVSVSGGDGWNSEHPHLLFVSWQMWDPACASVLLLVWASPQRFPSGYPGHSVLPPEAGTVKLSLILPSLHMFRCISMKFPLIQASAAGCDTTFNTPFHHLMSACSVCSCVLSSALGLMDYLIWHIWNSFLEQSVQLLMGIIAGISEIIQRLGCIVCLCVRGNFSSPTSLCIQTKSFESWKKKKISKNKW